jgi:hypothetical protein
MKEPADAMNDKHLLIYGYVTGTKYVFENQDNDSQVDTERHSEEIQAELDYVMNVFGYDLSRRIRCTLCVL